MCVTLSSPRTVSNSDKDVGEVVASCDLYLMDVKSNLLLPNKRYRAIDPKLNRILGSSASDAKLSTKFRYAYVEVLPLAGKKYLDDGITLPATRLTNQKLGYVIEVNKNLLMPKPTSTSTSAPLPIGNGVNKLYMDWLKDDQGLDPWPDYEKVTKPPFLITDNRINKASQITKVELTGSPSIPVGAKLIDVNDLMNNFKSGVNKKDYSYLNLLENSPIATDKDISKTFMYHINNGNLPSQYYYILGHGNSDILAGYNGSGAPIRYLKTSMQLLKSDVQSKGYNTDKTIIFLACHLGNGVSSFAELFSQLPDVGTVYAFTGFGWFGGTRPFWTAAGYNVSYKETDASGKVINTTISVYSKAVKGYWRIFNSATAVIKS